MSVCLNAAAVRRPESVRKEVNRLISRILLLWRMEQAKPLIQRATRSNRWCTARCGAISAALAV